MPLLSNFVANEIKIVDGGVGRGAGCLPVLRLHQPHGGRKEQVVQSVLCGGRGDKMET